MAKIFAYLPILLLPTFMLRIPLGSLGTINVLDLLLFTSISYFFLTPSLRPKLAGLTKAIHDRLLIIISSLTMVIGFVLSYLINLSPENWSDGLGILKSFLVLPILFSFALYFLSKKNLIKPDGLLITIFCLSSILAILGYFFALFEIFTFDRRMAIFFESPNQYAMVLVPGILAGVALINNNSSQLKKFLISVGIIACLFSLYLSFSQGAWTALVFSLIFLYDLKRKADFRKKTRQLLFFLIIILSFFVFFTPQITNIFDYQENIPPTSIDSRMIIYKVNQKILAENWIWGIGPGNYQIAYLENQKFFSPFPQWAVPHGHNNLLQLFIEGGTLSFLGFLGSVYFLFFKTKKPSLGFLAIALFFLIQGIVDTTIWRNDTGVLWWIAILFSDES